MINSLISLVAVFSMLFSFASTSQAASISGTACSKAGDQYLEARKLFTCTKVATKLLWKFTDDNTSSFAPFLISGPSWLEIASQREDAERVIAERRAKEAAELKAKRDAEIAAGQLKARLEAEAKAAKAEAEKPKIQGLTIGNLLWSDDFKGNKGASINGQNWSARNCHRVPASLGGGACFDAEVV